jgi:hypothetical protein
MKPSARFKKGDRVVFSGKKYRLQAMKETGTDVNKEYTVIYCREGSSVSGYQVLIEEADRPFRTFCQDWFELSKSGIISSILKEI